MKTTLQVENRAGRKVSGLRENKLVPGVVYGPKQPNIAIAVAAADLDKTYKQVGESAIVTLTGLETEIEVLFHGIERLTMQAGIAHVDFYAIERGKEITTNVPLEFIGEAPIEKTGGMVNKVIHELEVTCRPSKLPAKITVDISVLTEPDQKILVSDLKLSEGVTVSEDPTEVVAVAEEARVAEEETTAEAEVAPETETATAEKKTTE